MVDFVLFQCNKDISFIILCTKQLILRTFLRSALRLSLKIFQLLDFNSKNIAIIIFHLECINMRQNVLKSIQNVLSYCFVHEIIKEAAFIASM